MSKLANALASRTTQNVFGTAIPSTTLAAVLVQIAVHQFPSLPWTAGARTLEVCSIALLAALLTSVSSRLAAFIRTPNKAVPRLRR